MLAESAGAERGLLHGRYRPLARLGEGAFAVVELATDTLSGQKVAVKTLREKYAGSERMRRLLANEAAALSMISSERVVKLVHAGEDFLALEPLDGHPSSSFRYGQRGVVALASGACEALADVHAAGVVHRDLKPQHLLVVHGGIRVIDFGYSKIPGWDYAKVAGHDIGTAEYMSPELTKTAWEADLRSDLYSLGVIMYEKLAGSPPFEDEDPGRVAKMHRYDRPEPLPRSVNPALAEIVLRALSKKPEERFADAREMLDSLSRISRLV